MPIGGFIPRMGDAFGGVEAVMWNYGWLVDWGCLSALDASQFRAPARLPSTVGT